MTVEKNSGPENENVMATPLNLKVGDLMVSKSGTRRTVLEFDCSNRMVLFETTKRGKTSNEQIPFDQLTEHATAVDYILDHDQQIEANLQYHQREEQIIRNQQGMDFDALRKMIEHDVASKGNVETSDDNNVAQE